MSIPIQVIELDLALPHPSIAILEDLDGEQELWVLTPFWGVPLSLAVVPVPGGEWSWETLRQEVVMSLPGVLPEQHPHLDLLPQLSSSIPVSIVITTCDRPEDLESCLRQLLAQQTSRPVEIIVADNRPHSGITPPVVEKFPGVKWVQEARSGSAYGRNAAIVASTGEIVVTVDDDITVPVDWLEKLIAPLARSEVVAVTGNVLPKELETRAQVLFEALTGGLGSGYERFEVDGQWLGSFAILPAIGELGVSANAAFRASIFSDPQIGLMDEALGAGTPTGGGEETYLFYKILRAGHTLVYEPTAFVWHRHRRELPALYRQHFCHWKGGIAFLLRVWLQAGDRRAFPLIFRYIPEYVCQRVVKRFRGQFEAPWPYLWSEILGYLLAFWCLAISCLRVRKLGRSTAYVPPADRRSPQGNSIAESEPVPANSSSVGGEIL